MGRAPGTVLETDMASYSHLFTVRALMLYVLASFALTLVMA